MSFKTRASGETVGPLGVAAAIPVCPVASLPGSSSTRTGLAASVEWDENAVRAAHVLDGRRPRGSNPRSRASGPPTAVSTRWASRRRTRPLERVAA